VASRGRDNLAGAVDDRRIDYRILGSFEVRVGGRLVGLGGEKPRALLAILLLHRNEVVSVDRLVDELWGESPPETALRTVRAYVSRLRKALGANGTRAAEDASAPGANGASRAGEADCAPDANGGGAPDSKPRIHASGGAGRGRSGALRGDGRARSRRAGGW
jgi:hypothetical protein